MAVNLFKLVGSVFVDTDEANKSLQKTDKTASNVAAGIGKTVGAVAGVATAIIGTTTAVAGATMEVANDTAEAMDVIDKASIRMGISAESYQELAYAAGQCGVEMGTMEAAAKKLEGKDINFDDAIASIMELGTAEERSAKATELFGKNIAYKLSPLIEQSGDDFDGLIQRANDLGLVMSGDAVKAGVEFRDLMSDLKQTFDSLKNQLGSAMIPMLNELLKGILDNVPTIQSMIKQFLPPITDFMVQFIPQMAEMSQQFFPLLMDFATQIFGLLFEVITTLMPTALELSATLMPIWVNIIQILLPVLLQTIQALLPLITALLPLVEPMAGVLTAILVPLAQLLSDLLPPIIAMVTHVIEGVMPALITIINFVAETIRQVMEGTTKNITGFISQIISVFEGVATFLSGVFTGDWEKAWSGIVMIAKGFVNTLISYIQLSINGIIQGVNIVIDGALRLANMLPNVDIDTSVAKIPEVTLPMLAKGGVITEEGQAIVGENGAELLTLPKGARVEPLPNSNIDYTKLANSIVNAMKESGFGNMVVPVYIGQDLLETQVVNALATANYRSGGR